MLILPQIHLATLVKLVGSGFAARPSPQALVLASTVTQKKNNTLLSSNERGKPKNT